MKKLYKNAGIRIRFLREERHYTREYLAEMADISPKFYRIHLLIEYLINLVLLQNGNVF